MVVVGSWGRDDGLVASVAMADTGERASHSVGCVEEALRAGQGGQAGADKQDRLQSIKLNFMYRYFILNTYLMTEHGCPSSNLNRLSNRGRGRSLSFYRRARSTQYSIQNVHEPAVYSVYSTSPHAGRLPLQLKPGWGQRVRRGSLVATFSQDNYIALLVLGKLPPQIEPSFLGIDSHIFLQTGLRGCGTSAGCTPSLHPLPHDLCSHSTLHTNLHQPWFHSDPK